MMPPQPWTAWLSSSRAPSDEMIIGTLCFSHSARAGAGRLFERCTIWLTANGADGGPGCALSYAASSSLIRPSHSSSSSAGRAFSAGNDPTTPALHCAITRSGTEMMNSGAPITGIDSRPLNKAGMDIRNDPSVIQVSASAQGCQTSTQQGNLSSVKYCVFTLLAQSPRHEIFGPAVVGAALVPRQERDRRAFFGGIGVEALAFLETLALAELVGAGLAFRCALGGDHAGRAPAHHRRRLCVIGQAPAGVPGARVEFNTGLARAHQGRQHR